MAEVRDIAGEVGLEARFIDQAAASLTLTAEGAYTGLLGGPMRTQIGETFDRPLTDGEQMEVVEAVRGLLNHHGRIKEVMGSVEWNTVGRMTQVMVTVTSTDHDSSIRVSNDASGLAALTWVGSITAGLVMGGVAITALDPSSLLMTASLLGTGGAIGLGVARTIWSRTTKVLRRKSERLRDEIVQRLNP